MSARIEHRWFVSCKDCTLTRTYFTAPDAARAAEEHDKAGCPGNAPWYDLKAGHRR